MKRIPKESVLSLKHFIRRQQVIALYRNFFKSIKTNADHDPTVRDHLLQQVRTDFRTSKHITDNMAINSLITEANRNLTRLKDLKGKQRNLRSTRTKMTSFGSSPLGNYFSGDHSTAAAEADKDSWLSTKDVTDKRGRLGEGWPWSK